MSARTLALWGNLASDSNGQKRRTVRFIFGLQEDLLQGAKFYLSIPGPRERLTYGWEMDLARYPIRDR
jgi:hypothetical protein